MTHMYGLMHGGLLGMHEWEEQYHEVMQELQKAEKALDDTLAGTDADKEEEGEKQADGSRESLSVLWSKKKKKQSQYSSLYLCACVEF